MTAERIANHPRGLLVLVAAALSVAGCASNREYRMSPDTRTVVQRPTYPVEGTKPFYLGGYAGAYYGPDSTTAR